MKNTHRAPAHQPLSTPSSCPASRDPRATGWCLAFLSGFLVLSLETAYARLFALHLSQSTYGFGLMVSGFVAGLGLAAVAVSRLVRRVTAFNRFLGTALLGAGAALAVSVGLLESVGYLAVQVTGSLNTQAAPQLLFIVKFLCGWIVLLPPAFLLGLLFPVILARLSARPSRRAARVGAVYGLNTLGSVLGVLCGALVLVPWLGPQGAIQAGALVCAGLGLVVIVRSEKPFPAPVRMGVPAVLVFTAIAVLIGWGGDQGVLLRSPAIYARTEQQLAWYRSMGSMSGASELLFKRSDSVATVAVGRRVDPSSSYPMTFFSINGKIEGSNLLEDMMNQVRIADWPFAFTGPEEEGGKVLIIGLGTGVTAGQALRYPVDRVDVCELSEAVIEVAREYFPRENNGALDDARLRLLLADGRRYAAATGETYRLIISEPSNPWVAGMGSLFTRECYEIFKRLLAPRGVMGQWLHVGDLDLELFRSAIATFHAVFPRCYLVSTYPYGWDLMLIGLNPEEAGPLPEIESMLSALAARAPSDLLDAYDLSSVDDLCFGLLAGPEALADFSRGAPLVTDDNGLLEFEVPKQRLAAVDEAHLVLLQQLFLRMEPADRLLAPGPDTGPGFSEQARARLIDAMVWMRLRRPLDGILSLAQPILLEEVEALCEIAKFALSSEERVCSHAHLLAGALAAYAPDPRDPEGRCWQPLGKGADLEKARKELARAVTMNPSSLAARYALAFCLEHGTSVTRYGAGARLEDAVDQYRAILDLAPGDWRALQGYASILLQARRFSEAEILVRDALPVSNNRDGCAQLLEAIRQAKR